MIWYGIVFFLEYTAKVFSIWLKNVELICGIILYYLQYDFKFFFLGFLKYAGLIWRIRIPCKTFFIAGYGIIPFSEYHVELFVSGLKIALTSIFGKGS